MEINNLIFLHIPKAGGTTLNSILGNQYGRSNRIYINGIEDGIDKAKKTKVKSFNKTLVFTGHMAFGLHEYLPGNSKYITYLRSPVDRVISLYQYILQNSKHPLHKKLIEEKITLQLFVAGEFDRDTENSQTKLLAGIKASENKKNLLQIALENINNHFVHIGILEMFDESLILIARRLKWSKYVYLKQNVTNKNYNNAIDDNIINIIQEKNKLDSDLYKIFKNKLIDECKLEGQSFYNDLKYFQKYNKLYQAIMHYPYMILQKIRFFNR